MLKTDWILASNECQVSATRKMIEKSRATQASQSCRQNNITGANIYTQFTGTIMQPFKNTSPLTHLLSLTCSPSASLLYVLFHLILFSQQPRLWLTRAHFLATLSAALPLPRSLTLSLSHSLTLRFAMHAHPSALDLSSCFGGHLKDRYSIYL